MTSPEPVATAAPDSLPYVGLRPFEASESDRFFGRDRDRDLLCDKILAGRLTILYAQSGLGKSSVLRAAVIPALEEDGLRVIYFDAWAQDEPLSLLKDALIRNAGRLGIPHAGRGSPTLTELARMLCSVDERGLVLVLDQFEEFLVHHSESLDAVRSELAGLIRASKLDVTVVLSLREEFLASLEPLRQEILNLFQSTYRLESLKEDALRLAITQPAQLFGGDCTAGLAERLMADLRGVRDPAATGGLLQAVELPMLQLVCKELWKVAPQGRLTLDLYETQGGAKRILDAYVHELMPKGWRDQSFTARLLLHLAPPSGLKISYAAEDLAVMTGLNMPRVQRELERLGDARILRTRDYRNALRYELQHDAFIPVLQGWRGRVLERERRLTWTKRLLVASASVAVIIGGVFGFHYYQDSQESRFQQARESEDRRRQREQEEFEFNKKLMGLELESAGREKQQLEDARQKEAAARQKEAALRAQAEALRDRLENWQTGGILDDLRAMSPGDRSALAPGRFEVVTYYVLWMTSGPQRITQLRALLDRYADLLPDNYGMATVPRRLVQGAAESWPLRVEHSDQRSVDEDGFNLMWEGNRNQVTSEWGIPLPTHVRLVPTAGLPRDQFSIIGEGNKRVSLTIPVEYEGLHLVTSTVNQLKANPAREFLESYDREWRRFSPFATVDYRLAPKWSLPVWKLAGASPMSDGAIAAYLTVLELLTKPEPLFSSRAVDALLDHAAKAYPATVAEARASHGAAVGTELATRVRGNREALAALPHILDELAERPAADRLSSAAPPGAASSPAGFSQATARMNRLNGPWAPQQDASLSRASVTVESGSGIQAYSDLGAVLSNFPRIRVSVAANLIPVWFPGGQLSKDMSEVVERVRTDTYRLYGVQAPGFRFKPFPDLEEPGPDKIRVEVQGGPRLPTASLPSQTNKLDDLARELRSALAQTRTMWVTPENISELLKGLPPGVREWLEKRYSVTDLKRLLRAAMVAPAARGGIRYSDWLLNALPFWVMVDDPLDEAALGRHLRDTARARSEARSPTSNDSLRTSLEEGADALVSDDLAAATTAFERALDVDRNASLDGFPAVWAARVGPVFARDLARRYPSLDNLTLDPWQQADLEELNAAGPSPADRNACWECALYRLATDKGGDEDTQTKALRDLLSRSGDAERAPEHARWVALRFLKQYSPIDPGTGGTTQLAQASALFKSALGRLEGSAAVSAFAQLADVAQTTATPNWAWRLLDEAAKQTNGDAAPGVRLELAWRLSHEERGDRLRSALALIDEYERLVTSGGVSAAKPDEQQNIKYVRAQARAGLVRLGEDRAVLVEPLLRELLGTERVELQKELHARLAQLLGEDGKYAPATDVATRAAEKWPDAVEFSGPLLYTRFRAGDVPGLRAMASPKAPKPSTGGQNDDGSWLFVESLAATMTQSPDWQSKVDRFLATNHPNGDYVRMIAYAYAGGASSPWGTRILRERWASIDPGGWSARIANGDASAWREMLIGRFVQAPASDTLLAAMNDGAVWEKSSFSQLPAARAGLECEAWFYEAMKAKAEGQRERMADCLRRSLASGFTSYFEYAMATFLLASQS